MADIFVVGAGASACAGAPLIRDFHEASAIVSERLRNNPRDPGSDLFQKTLQHWKEKFSWSNIEEYYVLSEVIDLLGIRNPIPGVPVGFSDAVQYLIAKTLVAQMPIGNSPTHDEFARSLIEKGATEASVITLNWDLAIENAILRLPGSPGVSFGYHDSFNLEEPGKPTHGGISVFKLHGSLNWWFCKTCSRLFYQQFEKTVATAWEHGGPPCPNPACAHNGMMMPLMVPPTSQKLAEGPKAKILREIWNEAHDKLATCTRAFFIGYSFPPTDIQFRMYVLDALAENENLTDIHILTSRRFGSSKMQFEDHYGTLLSCVRPEVRIHFDYQGFEQWSLSLNEA